MTDEKRGKGIPFVKGSETSADAADSIVKPSAMLRRRVLHHIIECGNRGATDEEIQIALDMAPNTQRPRRVELEKAREIYKKFYGGKHVKRITKSGRKAGVYIFASLVTEWPVTRQSFPSKDTDTPDDLDILPEREITMGRQGLIDCLGELRFTMECLEMELRHGDEIYDSTDAIKGEMTKIIDKFREVVEAGRIYWKEVHQSEQNIQ